MSDQMKICYQVSKETILSQNFFQFFNIGVVNLNLFYSKIDATINMLAMNLHFSLDRSLIKKSSNKTRTTLIHQPSIKSLKKQESFETADYLPEFFATQAHFILCSSNEIEIVHLFALCPVNSLPYNLSMAHLFQRSND